MDPLPQSVLVRKTLQRIEPPDSVAVFRPIQGRCRVEGPGPGVAQPLCFGQISFALTQPSLGSLQILNIDVCSIPPDAPSRFVTRRDGTVQEPSILTVGTSISRFGLERDTRRYRLLPTFQMVRSIVGMKQLHPAGASRLLQGKIEIGQPTLIEAIAISVGQVGPEEYRCIIDNGTQLVFRLRGVCFHQAPTLRFACSKSAVQTSVLQRHRGLRSEQLEH